MQESVHVLRHTFWNIFKIYFVQLETLKSIVGTLIQYLLDGNTFIIRTQCYVLEVLLRILLINYYKFKSQNTYS